MRKNIEDGNRVAFWGGGEYAGYLFDYLSLYLLKIKLFTDRR